MSILQLFCLLLALVLELLGLLLFGHFSHPANMTEQRRKAFFLATNLSGGRVWGVPQGCGGLVATHSEGSGVTKTALASSYGVL